MDKFRKYHEAVEYLENLPSITNGCFAPSASKNPEAYLERMRWFLELLGNPDKELEFVHITGTSGKGSVSTMLSGVISESGKKTGLFTSPFATTSIEKISVDGKYIFPREFVQIMDFFKPYIEKAAKECPWGRPTYFEIFLAIALFHFKKKGCEMVVLEVGCGGRYDASNVVEKKPVAAVTNIDLDHMHIIGDTLEKIAFEKAGIIKGGCEFFTTEKRPEILEIFSDVCGKEKVRMNVVEEKTEKIRYSEDGMEIKIEGLKKEIASKLWGEYQEKNISLVVEIAKFLGIGEEEIVRGIAKANLPCRFEIIQEKPLVVLDGAHNPAKMASTVSNVEKLEYGKMILILGISQKKDVGEILETLIPKADHVIFTTFDFGPCFDPEKLAEISREFLKDGVAAESMPNKEAALEKALSLAGEKDLVLATGSFYLSGELRKKWISEDYILENLESFQ
ncbi:MAG: FolC bifunctional protein [Parcubacteria group bacterium GW2011_GWC1_45_14]|nr:MAG: FolC bifunctional protein [Candidatus Moranbacteria bacterium GW2011_GWC2_45_10]KKT95221.1 MAG: FolC bifunctional protein [Parcubacteria group bacterium GW2011_GWC1_45_14]